MPNNSSYGLASAKMLLPGTSVDLTKWSVIACDQHTSDNKYWEQAAALAAGFPSALNLIYPEAYLHESEAARVQRIKNIHSSMDEYLSAGVLTRELCGGIIIQRTTGEHSRIGLLLQVDLEHYDFAPDYKGYVRSTEGTVISRIPPRVAIRSGAALELSHVMLLCDDPEFKLISPLYETLRANAPLYDFDLMLGGGRIKGFHADEAAMAGFFASLEAEAARRDDFFIAVGDGNHSLATARAYWLSIRDDIPQARRADHPARYALAELVNLHDNALTFEPIHRVIFNASPDILLDEFLTYCVRKGINCRQVQNGDITFVNGGSMPSVDIYNKLAVGVVQDFLDEYIAAHPECEIDYIHGADATIKIAKEANGAAILLSGISKETFFDSISKNGQFPRKTFSMGEANEKRYYLEAKAIK